jgi:transcriptional regulator with XRE-family HTH domain
MFGRRDNMIKDNEKIYLGQVIKNKRLEKKATQKEIAQKIGLSRNYLSDIENGRYMPSVETLIKIASILELDLNFLKSTNISEVS